MRKFDNEFVVDVVVPGAHHAFAVTDSGVVHHLGANSLMVDLAWEGTESHPHPWVAHLLRVTPQDFRSIPGTSDKIVSKISCATRAVRQGNYLDAEIIACIATSGELFTWGYGYHGKLGHGNRENQPVPKLVEALSGVICEEVDVNGFNHAAIVTRNGKLYTFGNDNRGVLGHGDDDDKLVPTLVKALENKHITQVQCGRYFTIALSSTGYVYTWGWDLEGDGCLGHAEYCNGKVARERIPRLVEGLRTHNVIQISCGGGTFCGVLVDPTPSTFRLTQQAQFNNKENSDVTFIVENEPIYANIDDLSRQSEFFEAMFRTKMRESIEKKVVLPDEVSREVFLKLLEYLYLDDFTLAGLDVPQITALLDLADMYLLETLQLLCKVYVEDFRC